VPYILLCCILLACIWGGAVAAGRGTTREGWVPRMVMVPSYISIAFCLLLASELGLLRLRAGAGERGGGGVR